MRDDWEKLTTIEFQKTDICQGDLLDNDNTYGIKINGILFLKTVLFILFLGNFLAT